MRAALEKAIDDIITYDNLKDLVAGNGLLGRRHYYDDVTVIVIFLNKRSDTPTMEPEFQPTTEPEFQPTPSRNDLKVILDLLLRNIIVITFIIMLCENKNVSLI